MVKVAPSMNVFGEPLESCSYDPETGFFRNGHCDTCAEDVGSHTVCVLMSEEFLRYSKEQGNDLTTAQPELGFPGLRAGDYWCLCAARWLQAWRDGQAPKLRLRSTHQAALEIIDIAELRKYAVDLH